MIRSSCLTIALGFVAVALAASSPCANAQKWEPITSKVSPNCEAPQSCRLVQSNATFEIRVIATVSGGVKTPQSIEIRNLEGGEPQTFSGKDMTEVVEKESFPIWKVKLRPDSKDFDIAVYTLSSAKDGEVFQYLIYDAAKKAFVKSDNMVPKVAYDAKSKLYISELQARKFSLGPDLKLKPVQ